MCRLDELLQIESTYVTSKQIQKQYIISTPEALLKSLPVMNLFSPHSVTSVFILDHLQVSLRSPIIPTIPNSIFLYIKKN